MTTQTENVNLQKSKNVNPQNSNEQNIQNASIGISLRYNNSTITLEEQNTEQKVNLVNQLDPNQKSITTIAEETAYPNANWVILESFLERNGLAVKPTNFTLEVIGIYSLPDFWIKMEQSGAVDTWGYQVIVGEAKCVNGKMKERELTEEEKNHQDNKKKPNVDKKNAEAMKAEEERLKKLKEEREEIEKKFYDELKKHKPIEQYYKIKEMPTQADYVTFSEQDKINTVELKGDKLIEMEEAINDDHNIIIEVNKIPPPDGIEKM